MKKLLILFLIPILLFCACGSKKSESETTTAMLSNNTSYSKEQLQEIADYDGTKEEIMAQYDGGFLTENSSRDLLTYTNEDCSSVLVLFLDKSGQKQHDILFEPIHSKAVYEALEVGTTAEEIKELDPHGGQLTGFSSGKSFSNHCTTDGFYVSIEYDVNGLLCSMNIEQIFSA